MLSGQTIRRLGLVVPCLERAEVGGLTHGLGPAGYDLRLDLGEKWLGRPWPDPFARDERWLRSQEFVLAATCERFIMPDNVLGRVCDKSTLARRGLTVQNTIIEPGWSGWLTLELVNHSNIGMALRQGQAIAQVIFEFMDEPAEKPYPADGKYQDQGPGPQGAR